MKESTREQKEKNRQLKERLSSLGRVAVAFSGGVDSAFLLRTAHDVLGENCVAITAVSRFFPERETEEAKAFCKDEGIKQILVSVDPLSVEGIAKNPRNRCYLCKKEIFGRMLRITEEEGFSCLAEGSNMDDLGDYRPGLKAVEELGVKSPLKECGLYKADIRTLSRELGLPTWEKPSFACLASRFVYGESLSPERLSMVEQAENLLLELGFSQFRVRVHGNLARIEVLPDDIRRFMQEELRERISSALKELGFSYVALDLEGYRSGSMNETVQSL